MKSFYSLFFSCMFFGIAAVAQTTWKADPDHSKLGFITTHLSIADVTGYFENFQVTITASNPDFSDAVVEMTAQVHSINTAVAARDQHLKSADFLDAEQYPIMTYKSKSLIRQGVNHYKLLGILNMHGKTEYLSLDLFYKGTGFDSTKNRRVAGIQITGSLNRLDFNVGKGFSPHFIGNEVRIKADGEFYPIN